MFQMSESEEEQMFSSGDEDEFNLTALSALSIESDESGEEMEYNNDEMQAANALQEMARGATPAQKSKKTKKNKSRRGMSYQKYDKSKVDAAWKLYKQGKPVKYICAQVNRSRTTVLGWIKKKGKVGKSGRRGILTEEEGMLLEEHVLRMDDMGYGYTRDTLILEVADLLKNDPKDRLKEWPGRVPSK